MSSKWLQASFETCIGGVSSAVTPELLPDSQFAWGANIAIRGGKPHTRPPFVERLELPSGLHQGSSYFGIQGGMIVSSINGRMYRLRIGGNNFSFEQIPLGFVNSGTLKQVWMQQTIESLVIQDGQSNAIIYDGSTSRRAASNEVPRGTAMAYGNGRLWVAINKKELVAGDIRTRTPGSELKFTETNYLSGGGSLYFPRGITGLEFIPVTGAADFGTLIVFGRDYAESIRADVTSRDMWAQMPGFVTNVFRDIGCAGDWSIVQVNQDLYWRDSRGDIRSLANSISTSNTPGSTPISREVQRLVDFDSDEMLPWVSAIYFDNRLLMTSSPYRNVSRGISFKDLVALDFSPISTMQGKSSPAYDGAWTGIPGIAQLITGEFDGKNRAFAISSGEDGTNRLWEIMTRGEDDSYLSCGSGSIPSRVESFIEYPSINFGSKKQRKRLERCDVWLSGLVGEFDLRVFWRTDNSQRWIEWDAVETCARTTDNSTATPHVWKNLLPEQRPQVKSFTIPQGIDAVTKYAQEVGFYFQIRVLLVGANRVERTMLLASPLDDPDFANRETLVAECIENDVTGNELRYTIPTIVCEPPDPEPPVFEQYDGPFAVRYLTEGVDGDTRAIFSFSFRGMDHSHGAGLSLGGTTDGIIASEWSGESTYDPETDSYTGLISVTVTQSGVIPTGVNFYAPAVAPVTVTGHTFDEILAALAELNIFTYLTRSFTDGTTADSRRVRKWFSETPGPAVGGYFAGYTMARMWADGFTLTVTSSNQTTPESLGIPISLTGDPARTQHVTGFDPVTGVYAGTKSRARQNVVIPSGKTKMYGEFKYLVTPDDGSTPYYFYDSKEYDVLGGTTYNAVTWFPWIVDAVVYYVSGTFSFVPTYFLGWSSAPADSEAWVLPAISSWPQTVQFTSPPANAEAWDDFNDYGGSDTAPSVFLETLFTGYGWEEDYFFIGADPVDAYDDFESYSDGALSRMTQGVGWAMTGFFILIPTYEADDEFETYPDGAITALNVYGAFWAEPGFFIGP